MPARTFNRLVRETTRRNRQEERKEARKNKRFLSNYFMVEDGKLPE